MYVSPDSYLFRGTIYDNLILAKNLSESDILRWLEERQLLQFIGDFPEGLETEIGENGMLLSPGQRQQLICARALLAERPIYIFDEMTSSIDSENEEVLFDYIKMIAKEAIVLFISHKMKQVLQADEILFFESNHHISNGHPTDLLHENNEFRRLVETQDELEAILHGNH